jgi:hypothetical protein
LVAFTPRQQDAMRAVYSHRYVLYGGARGGGKSYWLRWALVEYLIYLYQVHNLTGVRVMLACETYPDLRDRQITRIKREFPSWLGKLSDSLAEGLSFRLDPSLGGGVIALRNLDDPSKYQSAEFAAIAVDELTKIDRETFDILRGSLRWPNLDHTVFLAATNPGGVGHAWVKALWIDRDFPPELRDRANEFIFIPALPSDNPHLSKAYWDELNSLPPTLRRAWVEGDWSVFSGMAFPTWSEAHVVNLRADEIPAHWPRVVGIDWGFAQPFCALWLARDPDTGRYYVYREVYAAGLTDQQQARLIREHSLGESIMHYYADPSLFSRNRTGAIVQSTADVYSAEGVALTPADNDRLSGKRKVDRLLQPLPDGRPGLVVSSACRNLIRTLPALVYDEHNPEDVDTDQEDHAYDALRYALTDPRQGAARKKPVANPWMQLREV